MDCRFTGVTRAYEKCIFEGTVLYGDTVSGDNAQWNRRVTFEGGSEYDVDVEKLYIRPYADGAPGDKIYAIGGFEEMEEPDMVPSMLQAILGY